jgi:hypothetical protein
MRTEGVIDQLTANVRPVKPLRHPLRRGMGWLAGTTVLLAVLVAMKALVSGTEVPGLSPWLVGLQMAAVVTSVTAAFAAFATVVPGMSHSVLRWPFVATTTWVAGLLAGTFQEGGLGAAQAGAVNEWPCVLMIALGSLLPVVVLTRLLRKGAPLSPRLTMSLGVLAAAGATNVGACLSQPHTSSAALMVWHGATILGLVSAGALAGRRILSWPRLDV